MVILFILLLLLAIWAAFKLGGVRKAAAAPPEADIPPGNTAKVADDAKFQGKGGEFGGGGASGSWGDNPS